MNKINAQVGDIVEVVAKRVDTTIGRMYQVNEIGRDWVMIRDDKNESNCIDNSMVKVVGKRPPAPTLKDIHGQEVKEGDYIAYAFAGPRYNHLAVFEVKAINGPVATCRGINHDTTTNIELGVFNERALKLKDYTK